MSLGKKLLRGAGVNVLEMAVKTVAMFITTPIMVRSFGQDGYGSWLLAMTMVGYLLVLDMGVTFSATRLMSIAVGARQGERLAALLSLLRRYFAYAGLVCILFIFASFWLTPWIAAGTHHPEIVWVLAICGAATVLRYWFRQAMLLLRAHVRYDLLGLASIIRTLCQTPAMCWALLHHDGLVGAAIVHASGEVLELILQWSFTLKLPKVPGTEAGVGDSLNADARKDLIATSRDMTLVVVGMALRREVNPILIARMSGVSHLPVYSLGMRLIGLLEDMVNAIFGGQVLAALGQLHGANDQEGLKDRFLKLSHMTAAFCAGAMGGVLWLSDAFLHRWVGENLSAAAQVTWILALPHALAFMMYPVNNLLYIVGKAHWMARVVFYGGCLAMVLCIVFGLLWGFTGVVVGSAIAMFVERACILPHLLYKVTGIPPRTYVLKHLLKPALLGVAPAALFALITEPWLRPDYATILLMAAGYTIVFALTAPWLALDASTRGMLWRMMPFIKGRQAD
ncbi:MAG: lipopolysaccharide biosynthesis protein [Roseimicrobium sp.]